MLLTSNYESKPNITLMISEDVVSSKGWNAGIIVRDLAKEIKGGGWSNHFLQLLEVQILED